MASFKTSFDLPQFNPGKPTTVIFEYGNESGKNYVKATEDGSENPLVYLYQRQGDEVSVGTIVAPGNDIVTIKGMTEIYQRCVMLMEALQGQGDNRGNVIESPVEFIEFFVEKDYPHAMADAPGYPALTLNPVYVVDTNSKKNAKEFVNDSGWLIKGEIKDEWYTWVNEFEAFHPGYGVIKGDFQTSVKAQSKEAFDHFWEHHEPIAWDYHEI